MITLPKPDGTIPDENDEYSCHMVYTADTVRRLIEEERKKSLPLEATPEMLKAIGQGFVEDYGQWKMKEAAKMYKLMVDAYFKSLVQSE